MYIHAPHRSPVLPNVSIPATRRRASSVRYNKNVASTELTQQNLPDHHVSRGVVVIDFWAAWCKPCSQFSPVFNAVADALTEARFFSVNTDSNQDLARSFSVQSLPTVIILINGNVAFRRAGVMTARELDRTVRSFVEVANKLQSDSTNL